MALHEMIDGRDTEIARLKAELAVKDVEIARLAKENDSLRALLRKPRFG